MVARRKASGVYRVELRRNLLFISRGPLAPSLWQNSSVSQLSRPLPDWLPRSIVILAGGYDAAAFVSDLIAGFTVGLVALPLAMAFAIASGLTPQAGIYCAIITGFLISALGGAKFQIGGPPGAF